MTIFPFLHRWGHTFSPSDYFFSSYLTICLGDYSSSVQKVVLVFFFFFQLCNILLWGCTSLLQPSLVNEHVIISSLLL